MAEWNRDLILANFQAASGLDDIETCISLLESHNWDLQTSLNSLFAEQDNNSTRTQTYPTSNSPIDVDTPSYINIDPDPIPIEDDIEQSIIIFQVLWHDRTLPVTINNTDTVGALKRLLEIQTGLSSDEINLEGWPNGDASMNNYTKLSTLNLCSEVHLVLATPAKVTVTAAEYLPCNIPACNIQDDDENDPAPRAINVTNHQPSSSRDQDITLVVNHNGRDYKLCYSGTKTIKHVKQELNLLTKISSNQQLWVGWPDGSNDYSRLKDLNLSADHFLMLSSSRSTSATTIDITHAQDSGLTGSPTEDRDLDEQIISDDDDDAIFDAEATAAKHLVNLLPRDSADSTENMLKLQHNFEERYGDFHPAFFMGTLKDAIDEAGGPSASESRPLLIYLHHDSSILTNIFCSQILCTQQFILYVSQNFTIWPWDMTHESNRQRFVNLLVQHFGNAAANTVSKYRNSEYPLLLIVMKSKGGLEVCSVLQANASVDEVMMGLINGYEVFEQAKIVEIKAESERNEREQMKQEQDDAYQMSLAADRAKADAERMKMMEEQEKQEKEHLEAQIKEAERISCQEQVPDEPPKDAKNITTIRFRLPEGANEIRRFRETDTLKIVFMFVASKGYSLNDYRIVTNFPRHQFTAEEAMKSLQEMKLCPQAQLFVEEV